MRSKKNASALPAQLLMSQLTCQPKLVIPLWPSGTSLCIAHILLIISFVTSFVLALISFDQQVKHQFVSVRLWPKMTSIVDSEAHLAKRATEVGLTDGALQSLVRNGLSTLGRLAFAHGQPGTPIDAAAFHTFAQNLLGALMSLADEAALKRLLFEGHTMVLSQLREAVANPEAAHTRKLPQVERNAKMVTLRAALPGVCIEKQLEPSHSLLDLVSQQFEAQQLAYLSPDRCTSREWEVAMGKTSKQIQLDTDHLVVKEKSDTPDQIAATEMQIYEATPP